MTKPHISLLTSIATLLLLPGCCLREIKLKPELGATDFAAAKAGTATFETTIAFKECCPTKEQKKLALDLQKKTAALYDRLLAGEIEIERYNALINAANASITNVILICNAVKKAEATGVVTPVTLSRITLVDAIRPQVVRTSPQVVTRQDLSSAWSNVASVLKTLESVLNGTNLSK
jgi:hypothetical protein